MPDDVCAESPSRERELLHLLDVEWGGACVSVHISPTVPEPDGQRVGSDLVRDDPRVSAVRSMKGSGACVDILNISDPVLLAPGKPSLLRFALEGGRCQP